MSQDSFFGQHPRNCFFEVDLVKHGPPIIFIDNLGGYIPVDSIPKERQDSYTSWGNTKLCAGFTFYANSEFIGVGIVVNDRIATIASLTLVDFFGISLVGEEKEASLLCVVQTGYDTVYMGAAIKYGSKVAYAGYSVNLCGLAVASPMKIESSYATPTNLSRHADIFNADGSSANNSIMDGPGDMVVTYETYNGHHGLSLVSRDAFAIDLDTASLIDPLTDLMSIAERDLLAIMNNGTFVIEDTFSIASSVDREDIYIIFVSARKISTVTYNGDVYSLSQKEIGDEVCSSSRDNMYQGCIFIKPPIAISRPKDLSGIYAPAGIFLRHNTFDLVLVTLQLDDGIMASYVADTTEDGIEWRRQSDENIIEAEEKIDIGYDCTAQSFGYAGLGIYMNAGTVLDSDIMAYWEGTVASREYFSSNGSSDGIRSMSPYIPYFS